jgi:hypothetical protein
MSKERSPFFKELEKNIGNVGIALGLVGVALGALYGSASLAVVSGLHLGGGAWLRGKSKK